jgi:hypothetical protein
VPPVVARLLRWLTAGLVAVAVLWIAFHLR